MEETDRDTSASWKDYVLTYGWAVLIVLLALLLMWALGAFDVGRFA